MRQATMEGHADDLQSNPSACNVRGFPLCFGIGLVRRAEKHGRGDYDSGAVKLRSAASKSFA